MARIRISGKTYAVVPIQKLSLRDIIALENESAELGRPLKYADVQALAAEIEKHLEIQAAEGKKQDPSTHPDWPWFFAILVWMARRHAGEDVSFVEAIEFPLDELEMLRDPGDFKAPKDPQKPRRKAKAKAKASGRGAAPAAAKRQSRT